MSALHRDGAAPDARSLFAAAREDAPDADERDVVFRRIALATGIAAGAAAAASVAPAAPAAAATATAAGVAGVAGVAGAAAGSGGSASVFSLKVLAIGAVIGAACTALGGVLVVALATPEAPARARGGADGHVRIVASGAKLASPQARDLDPNEAASRAARLAEGSKPAPEPVSEAKVAVDPPSDLAEEARLVTAARTALVAGEAARALSLVQATRKLGARALEPEELGLEARALRALGRADDAAATELVLRRRYPESALAR